MQTTHRSFTIVLLLVISSISALGQMQRPYDGFTPSGLQPGTTPSTMPIDSFVNVNLATGSLSFRLPLLTIGGRGKGGYSIYTTINNRFTIDHEAYIINCAPDCIYGDRYYVRQNQAWANRVPGLSPGFLVARHAGRDIAPNCPGAPSLYEQMLTRLTFVSNDETEYEFVDATYFGQIKGWAGDCYTGHNRGTVWVTRDGTSATFISNSPISDFASYSMTYPSGTLKWKDGTTYKISNGWVQEILDVNGNKVSIQYSGNVVTQITDSIGRVITNSGGSITYKGFGGAARTISFGVADPQLRPDYSSYHTHSSAFPGIPNLMGPETPVFRSGPTRLTLPNGQFFRFYYNPYGELARIDLPAGGKVEFDYDGGYGTGVGGLISAGSGIFRVVKEKRVYKSANDTIPIERTFFNRAWGSEPMVVDRVDPTSPTTILARTKHYFYGDPHNNIGSNADPITYPVWNDNLEYKTESFAAGGATLLQTTDRVFNLRTTINGTNFDPRLISETLTLNDFNLVSLRTFDYDQYNNRTDVYEYDFGAGAPGPLLRRIHTPYLTANPSQGNVNYATDNNIHIRNLPTHKIVYDAAGIVRSQTDFIYDYYGAYALVDCPGVVQHDSGFHTDYGARGNLTGVIRRNPGGSPSEIHLHNQYDIAGNRVKAVDGRGFAMDYDFSDRFDPTPDDEARSNAGAPELAGGFSYAFPTKVTNALGHEAYAQYDFYLGRRVNSEDINSVVSSVVYNDDLDRPTQRIQARYVVGVGVPAVRRQTNFTYDDGNRMVMTRSDRDTFNDNILTTKSYYDGLNRTLRDAAFEGSSWTITDMQFDLLGRLSKVSNPYRAADPGSASPPANWWTTTEYDGLDRVVKVTTPDGAHYDTAYSGNQMTVTDQAGKKRRSVTDALGRLVIVTEDPGGLNYDTTYLYDVLDNLRFVNQGGQGRWFSYDSLSRLIRVRNPEQDPNNNLPPHTDPLTGGNGWSTAYFYDENGNLMSKTDPRNITTTYMYDALNRNTSVDYSNTTAINPDITTYFDNTNPGSFGKGRYWHDYSGGNWGADPNVDHSAIDSYDPVGRPLTKRQLFKHNGAVTTYSISQTYDLASNVKSVIYPSGRSLNYGYDQAGRLNSVMGNLGDGLTRYYSIITQYHPAGLIERETFGAQTPLYLKLLYNKRHQLVDLRLGSVNDSSSFDRGALQFYYGLNGAAVQNPLVDEPNNNGNLVRQWSYVPKPGGGTVTTQLDDYSYDSLNRLAAFTEGQINESGVFIPNVVTQNLAYDRWGNRRVTSATGGVSAYNPTYDPMFFSNRIVGLGYDQAGNIISDPLTGGTMTYDAENRLQTATSGGGGGSYVYDASGQRVRRTTAGQQWWYVYGIGGELVAEYLAAAPTAAKKEYGYRNGQLLITADGGSTTNLAFGKTATQSSTDWGGVAGRGVDGNTSGNWANNSVTHTTVQSQPWWQVDLGSAQQIGAIKVWNRTDCCGERLSNFFVLVSDTPFTSTDLTATINQAGVSSYYVAGPVATATEVGVYRSGRYVRVQLAGTNALSVAEVEVRGGTGIQWLVADHLGSTRMVIDQTGSLSGIKRHDYAPFGEELTAGIRSSGGYGYVGSNVRQKFTGMEKDAETGFDNFIARSYSSAQGRFVSPDPFNPVLDADQEAIAIYANQPQNWNKYSYVLNQPLKYIDPDGKNPLIIVGAIAGAVIGAGAKYAEMKIKGERIDGRKIFMAGVGGALNGAIAGATAGASLTMQVATGIGANVIAGGLEREFDGDPTTQAYEPWTMLEDGVAGAFGGVTSGGLVSRPFANMVRISEPFDIALKTAMRQYRKARGFAEQKALKKLELLNLRPEMFGLGAEQLYEKLVEYPSKDALNYAFSQLQRLYRLRQEVDCSKSKNKCGTGIKIIGDDGAVIH